MEFSYQRVKKDDRAIIGVQGIGDVLTSEEWVPTLWFSLEEKLPDILEQLAIPEESIPCWGIMSDAKEWLSPWIDGEGLYLAGIDVPLQMTCPPGWHRSILPAMEYIVIRTTIPLVSEAVRFLFETVVPDEGIEIIGAIHEYYGPDYLPGEISLYAPINMG